MRAKQLITIAVVSMLLIGGVAAIGAASPADQANENAQDAHAENVSDENAAADGEDSGSAASAENDRGPKGDLPEQAPDHVSQIHETINRYLSGEVDNLGHALSDLLGGEDAADADADDETEDDESDDNDA